MKWQPIETAPMDGEVILIYLDGNWIASSRWVKTPNGKCWDFGLSKAEPTHWMPLPEPPEEE